MEEKVVKPQSAPKAVSDTKPSTKTTTPAEPVVEADSKVEQLEQLTDVDNDVKEVNIDKLIPSDPYNIDPLFYEVANYFGIEQAEYDGAKNKLSDIVDYVIRQEKSNAPEVVLKALRKLEDQIQRPTWDEKRYTNVHKYVRLAAKKETIQQAMSAFEGKEANG